MENGFRLVARVAGVPRHVTAEPDGYSFVVTTTTGEVAARTLHDAFNVAREHLGRFLAAASPPGSDWSLSVSVGSVQAWYPDGSHVPELPASARPAEVDSLVAKIRSRWNGSPRGALENAFEIIESHIAQKRAA